MHYNNVKTWIGAAVGDLMRTTGEESFLLTDAESKQWVLDHKDIKAFMSVYDSRGEAFEAFWVLDEKVISVYSSTVQICMILAYDF